MLDKNLTGARSGINAWLAQRGTALVMLILLPLVAFFILCAASGGHADLVEHMAHPLLAVLFILVVVAVSWHAYIGLCDIYRDYIQNSLFRLLKQICAMVYLAVMVLWSLYLVLVAISSVS